MAYVIVFPDQDCFARSIGLRKRYETSVSVIHPPRFCEDLLAPSLLVPGGQSNLLTELKAQRIPISGPIPYRQLKRETPEAQPPDPKWKDILGLFRLTSVQPSVTDPSKLRIEATSERWPKDLIPLMARLIRGGTYLPDVPVLAFEEEHRLIAFSPEGMVVSRADDLLDLWIMIRTAVDLVCAAYLRKSVLQPERGSRRGINAIEIFKRLPGTDCGICGSYSCMEFATALATGRCRLTQCGPLQEGSHFRSLESLQWLARIMGITPWQPSGTDIGKS